jgi:hypothetical protein
MIRFDPFTSPYFLYFMYQSRQVIKLSAKSTDPNQD